MQIKVSQITTAVKFRYIFQKLLSKMFCDTKEKSWGISQQYFNVGTTVSFVQSGFRKQLKMVGV